MDMGKFGIIYNDQRRDIRAYKDLITQTLIEEGIEVWCETECCVKENTDLIIVLGGDGTILRSFKEYAELAAPFMCVNFGKIGFLTSVEPEAFFKCLPKLLKKDYYIDNRSVLEFNILKKKAPDYKHYALNEIVIRSCKPVVSRISVYIDGFLCMDVEGDGIICATSTGSTAYSLSAGGAIVDSHINGIIITPICARGNVKSYIAAPDRKVQICINDSRSDYIIAADGTTISDLSYESQIRLKISPMMGRFVYFEKDYYYKKLSSILRTH
jgi:NAD+ kinase